MCMTYLLHGILLRNIVKQNDLFLKLSKKNNNNNNPHHTYALSRIHYMDKGL